MTDAPHLDAAADGAFSGKLADPADTLTKRGGKGIVVYEGQEYDRLAWTRRCAALGYTLAAGEGAILNAALVEVEKERDALRVRVAIAFREGWNCGDWQEGRDNVSAREYDWNHSAAKAALDAALPVQPTTEGL